ncbi:aryl-alcohol dehydrogenase [Obba rivulosa]|uniref:Aryl-alcohol dehydrogenase n=1 Tax=Obba rivulosa TaxID=1052685 RepID=A0A8E2AXI0_9APHY|nr:aryl-alcohol dehydrogenase [Obba rivulosa]
MASQTKMMEYVWLGNSGLKVSKIILGTMQYGSSGWQGWVIGDEEEATRHIKYAYDHGIQTFDTSNVYSNGLSEVVLGRALKKLNLPREEFVIMTKVYFPVLPTPEDNFFLLGKTPEELGLVNQHGLSRKHIFASIKASLERLQLDYVDVLQCHRFDYNTPIEETTTVHILHAMQNYAIKNNLTPFISMQNHYSLIYREEEREMFPTLKMFGVGSIPWSPLGRGLLKRSFGEQSKRSDSDWVLKDWKFSGLDQVVNRVEELAKKRGISMAQVSIAWILSKSGVTAPIVGTTSLDNLKDILGGVDVKLTEEEIKYLDEPYRPQNINGHT